jgi:hypothetical protein
MPNKTDKHIHSHKKRYLEVISRFTRFKEFNKKNKNFKYMYHKRTTTVDSRYLEFDGTMEKIWVNRSSTQEELRRYRKCGLFNNERDKEFNGEKKTATKTSNMFKIVPRLGTCNAGFSSSKFRSSCLPFVTINGVFLLFNKV